MKLVCAFLLASAICVFGYPFPASRNVHAAERQSERRLESQLSLSSTVVGQKYCTASHLRLIARLRYTNTGTQPIILYKYSLGVSRYMISRNIQTAAAEKYLVDVSPTSYTSESGNFMPGPRDTYLPGGDSVYVVLQPGESYTPELDAQVNVLDLYNGSNGDDDPLYPGDYVLEFAAVTWYDSKKLAEQLSERWQSIGFLWTKIIKTSPIPFKIEKHPPITKCL